MKRLPTWLEIDLDRLDRNIETIQNAIGADVGILLTVKADAYGHGAVQVASAAAPRVRIFGVATVDEAVELWESGIRNDILILSPILETELPAVVRHGFAVTLSSAEFADAVARFAPARPLDVHVEVDTGMGRTGVMEEGAFDEITRIARNAAVNLRGVYTHFPVSDTDLRTPARRWRASRTWWRGCAPRRGDSDGAQRKQRRGGRIGGVAHGPGAARADRVRAPSRGRRTGHRGGADHELEVAHRARAARERRKDDQLRALVHHRARFGDRRGTGGLRARVSVPPVGRGSMLVGGRRVPIVGRVTMDMTMVDLTDLPAIPAPGEEVVLVGSAGGETDHRSTTSPRGATRSVTK